LLRPRFDCGQTSTALRSARRARNDGSKGVEVTCNKMREVITSLILFLKEP